MIHEQKNRAIAAISILTILIGCVVMAGWILNLPILEKILPEFVAMKFNAALCFVFFGGATLLCALNYNHTRFFFLALVLAGTAIGLITFLEYALGFNAGLDQLFIKDKTPPSWILPFPGRMGSASAISFIGLGIGFLVIKSKNRLLNIVSQCSFQFVTIVATLTLIDSLYGSYLYSDLLRVTSMATHTACLFLFLSIWASLLQPSVGIIGLFTGQGIGNRVAKRLSALMLLMVIIIGGLISQGRRTNLFSLQGITLSLLVIGVLIISLLLIWNTANWLNNINEKRLEAEAAVKLTNMELERRVEERSAELTELLTQFKQNEEKYHSLIEHASDAIYLLDGDGNFLEVNKSMCELTGYERDELLQLNIAKLIDPEQLKADPVGIPRMLPNSTVMRERRHIDKNGKEFILETHAKRLANENILVIARNITERKRMEADLRASEQKYKLLFENNPIPLSMVAKDDMSIIAVNEATAALYGYDIEELRHMDVKNVRPPEDLHFQKESYQVTATEATNFGIVKHLKKDGSVIYVNIISQDIIFDGRLVRLSSTMDVTDQIKAEELLKKSEANLKTIMDATDVGYALLDKELNIIAQNSAAAGFADILFNKIPGKGDQIASYLPVSRFPQFKKYTEDVFNGININYEINHVKADGSLLWFNVRMFPIANSQNDILGVLIALTDVTDHKNSEIHLGELNENLKKQAKDLATSNAELEQFAYVASHDLQEPLRMVTSFMAQLERKYGDVIDEKGKQYINFAIDGAKRMRQIILDLLDFSRIGRSEDDQEDVDVNAIVSETLSLNRSSIEETGAEVIFENLPTIRTYKIPLRQVFQNLVGNALKYHANDRSPLVSISFKETKTQYQFAIKDNGIGIAKEYFDKIFIIFQRLHNKDEYSGTGMGLAITKKIVENMGGKIWLESTVGVGSTFYFTLPKNIKSPKK